MPAMKSHSFGYLELPSANPSILASIDRHARSITIMAAVAAVMVMHITLYVCVLIPSLVPTLAPTSMFAGIIAYALGIALWLSRSSANYTRWRLSLDCAVGALGVGLIATTIACFN